MPVFRSFLFAPGNHARRVEKCLTLGADAVILDLEDAVANAEKAATRAVVVQALLVAFYAAVARGLHIPVSPWHLAVMVPVSFIVQMIPISVNGFGVREATFVAFFALAGLPAEAAMLLSFMGTAVIMAWSLAGACVHLSRRAS